MIIQISNTDRLHLTGLFFLVLLTKKNSIFIDCSSVLDAYYLASSRNIETTTTYERKKRNG